MPGQPEQSRDELQPPEEQKEKNGTKNAVWLRLGILLLILAITFLLYKSGTFRFFLHKDRVLAFLDSLGPLSFLGFILLQATQVVIAPIPGEVTGIIGGYLYGPMLGVIFSTTGLVIGSFVAFSLSRAFGRPFVEKFVNKSVMDRFDYLLHRKGLVVIFLLFLLPGFPKDYLCFILGLGRITTMEFLLVSSVGRLFGTTLLTLGGGYIRCHQYGRLYVLVAVAGLVGGLAFAFRKKAESLLKAWQLRGYKKPMNRTNSNG